jgi:hypothetical protein
MLHKLLQLIGIVCRHRNMSYPFAAAGEAGSRPGEWESVSGAGGHYVVCLDCGKKFRYDWSAMRVVQ